MPDIIKFIFAAQNMAMNCNCETHKKQPNDLENRLIK